MKLISCDECGLVYDQDKIKFPEIDTWDDEGLHTGVNEELSEWNGETHVPVFKCSCGENVRKES